MTKHGMNVTGRAGSNPAPVLLCFTAMLLLLLLVINSPVASAQGQPAPKEFKVEKIEPAEAGLEDYITVTVSDLTDPAHATKLILFLDDVPIKGNYPVWADVGNGKMGFKLVRNDNNKNEWNSFLVKPRYHLRKTELKVGYEDQPLNVTGKEFNLRLYSRRNFRFILVGYLLALIVFLWLAVKTNIIRDSGPPEIPPDAKRPFSLARTQMAWWFFIIFGAFLLIRAVTDDYNTINTTALVLLGIGTGTALGAVAVDNNKRDSTRSQLRTLKPKQATLQVSIAELRTQVANLQAKQDANLPTVAAQELETLSAARKELAGKVAELEQVDKQVTDVASALNKPVSEGFLTDILSDVNGISFHRFQIVVWTITLGVIFVKAVYKELAMPEFNDTILGLMGISAGTYIGFKIPERQTDPETEPAVVGNAGGNTATGAVAGGGT